MPEIRTFQVRDAKVCLVEYGLLGWSGFVPVACRQRRVGLDPIS
jgi:hypothetical protein